MSSLKDIEIIDAHIHQWDPRNTPHALRPLAKALGWNKALYHGVAKKLTPKAMVKSLGGTMEHLCQPYLPEDFQADAKDHNVIAAVCTPYSWKIKNDVDIAEETAYIDHLFRNKSDAIKVDLGAIVGNAHLEKTDTLASVLKAHLNASNRFRGVRDMLDWSEDPKLLSHARKPNMAQDADWLRGLEILAEHDLFFDAFLLHQQLGDMSELAQRFPDTQFILSHMGTPVGAMGPYAGYGRNEHDRQRILAEWRDAMAALAENPNVAVKLTGLFLAKLGWGLESRRDTLSVSELAERLHPLVDFVIEQFGPERCMFVSHFAPDKGLIDYTRLYDIYKEIVKNRSQADQELLFAGTAKRVYKIDL